MSVRNKMHAGTHYHITILIPIKKHNSSSEKWEIRGDMRNKGLFFHCERQRECETGSWWTSDLVFLYICGIKPAVFWSERCCSSSSRRGEDGAVRAASYWICTEQETPNTRHQIRDTRYNLWQHAEINEGSADRPSPRILHSSCTTHSYMLLEFTALIWRI